MSAPPLPRPATLSRIPSLDGLRALSILLVVGLHTVQRYSLSHPVPRWWFAVFNGQSGVFIFFEISGFLITTLLLAEHAKRGAVSLRGFYVRRAFRILPPLYLYIGAVAMLGLAGTLQVRQGDVWTAVLFVHNIRSYGTWALEHLWSISMEEQFYFVWPFVLVYFLHRPNGKRAAAVFPIAILAVSPVARVLFNLSGNAALHHASLNYLRWDFIMYGCLVALLQHSGRFERVYRAATRLPWLPPAVILLCNALSARFENRFDLTVGYTINGFAMAIFMLWCTRNARSAVGRVLNWQPVAWIGVLSYSIYLWQTLFTHSGNEAVFAAWPWIGRFPGNWLGFMLAAVVSYYLVEQPSLRLRGVAIRQLHLYRGRRAEVRSVPQ